MRAPFPLISAEHNLRRARDWVQSCATKGIQTETFIKQAVQPLVFTIKDSHIFYKNYRQPPLTTRTTFRFDVNM